MPAMTLKTTISQNPENPGTLKVALSGSLDSATSPPLQTELASAISDDAVAVIFDLTELTFISSAGLRILIITAKRMKARGGKAVMLNPQPQIAQVFEIVNASPVFGIFSSEKEMDDYLATIQRKITDPGA